MIVLEAGINHFGKVSEAKKLLSFFLKSDFSHLTFMLHTQNFYRYMKKRIDFLLPRDFYKSAIKLAHLRNKKIGLAVCDIKSFAPIKDLNFDFYKLLGIAINNKELIEILKIKKKPVYISLAKGSDKKILKCLKYFGKKDGLNLIYTNMSYESKDLDLNRINYLKKKFKLPVGYGHHYKNSVPIYLSSFFNSSFYFVYIKNITKKKRLYPDNLHAFFLDQLKELNERIKDIKIILKKKQVSTKIKLHGKKIKF